MPSGAVLELPTGSLDLSLGDRVRVNVAPGTTGEPVAVSASPAPRAHPALTAGDYQHVVRMGAVFAAVVVLFLAWRAWMVPRDFGLYGHYRPGAIVEAAAKPSAYAGQAVCAECHSDVQKLRDTAKHRGVACEACHGPLGRHARGETDVAPIRPSARGVCLTCHTVRAGMPKAFPAIVEKDHAESGPCTECHAPHAPVF